MLRMMRVFLDWFCLLLHLTSQHFHFVWAAAELRFRTAIDPHTVCLCMKRKLFSPWANRIVNCIRKKTWISYAAITLTSRLTIALSKLSVENLECLHHLRPTKNSMSHDTPTCSVNFLWFSISRCLRALIWCDLQIFKFPMELISPLCWPITSVAIHSMCVIFIQPSLLAWHFENWKSSLRWVSSTFRCRK